MTKDTIKEEFNKKELEILQNYIFEKNNELKKDCIFENIISAWDIVTDSKILNNLSEEIKKRGADLITVNTYNKDGSVTNDYGETYRKWEVLTEEYKKKNEYRLKAIIISKKAESAENRRLHLQYMQLQSNYYEASKNNGNIK